MTRAKKAFLTSIASFALQMISIICGFILPRLFLSNYGSSVNGLVSSITQFLEFIALAECGIGAVVQSSLYKPFAEKNIEEVSKIFKSSDRFFKKIGLILLVYSFGLAFIYPYIVSDAFDFFYTASLILVISISTFARHYVGMSYRLLLVADQYGFISKSISCIALILSTIACVILVNFDMPIHIVKLASSLIFLAQPLVLLFIGKSKYEIDKSIVLAEEPIKQKWNGLAQHMAAVVTGSTDTVVLTLLSTLENVSIYSVYHMVVNGVKCVINALTAGYIAMFGNMLSKNEIVTAKKTFSIFEWAMHTLTTLAFGITGGLIVPFVTVYTKGITDADYIVPLFAILITIAQAAYCLRLPYNIMVMAAGHFKQTQLSAIIEAVLNLTISIVLVFNFGLIGVAIGTFVSMLYRTCYLAWYLSKNILCRNFTAFLQHCVVDAISVALIILTTRFLDNTVATYLEWTVLAVKCSCICIVIVGGVNIMFYRNDINNLIRYIKKKKTSES